MRTLGADGVLLGFLSVNSSNAPRCAFVMAVRISSRQLSPLILLRQNTHSLSRGMLLNHTGLSAPLAEHGEFSLSK
jgi:hypothetical protein